MSDHNEHVHRLMAEAVQLTDGQAKVALIEQAASVADSHQDVELGFEVRKYMLGACLGADESERMLVAFSWCLSQHDRDPERFPLHRIIWEFRWVVSSLPTFPEITLEKIREMQAEMVRRYRKIGASPRSYWLMCRKMAVDMGDRDEAAAADQELRKADEDWLADGAETEQGFEITYRLFRKEYAKGLKAAWPFVAGEIHSPHFEGQACADVLYPLLRADRAEEAMPIHARGYKMRSGQIRHLDSIAKHIAFLALTDNIARAVRLYEKHVRDALQTSNVYNRMRFLIDTLPLLDRLMKAGKSELKIRLPDEAKSEAVVAAEVRIWQRELAAELAKPFDQRNGNTHFAERLAEAGRMQRWFRPCPVQR